MNVPRKNHCLVMLIWYWKGELYSKPYIRWCFGKHVFFHLDPFHPDLISSPKASLKLKARTWKFIFGRPFSFWEGPFSGAMLVVQYLVHKHSHIWLNSKSSGLGIYHWPINSHILANLLLHKSTKKGWLTLTCLETILYKEVLLRFNQWMTQHMIQQINEVCNSHRVTYAARVAKQDEYIA